MIAKKIKKIFAKALSNYSQELSKPIKDLRVVIHTIDEKELRPSYFRLIDGKPEVVDGQLRHLMFAKEILFKKIDMGAKEELAAQYLQQKFSELGRSMECEPTKVSIHLVASDEQITDVHAHIFKGNDYAKTLSLSDLFE